MSDRIDLHNILKAILESSNVYFQPPESIKMQYPCIVYQKNKMDIKKADDKVYYHTNGYMITVIDPNPDSYIPERLLELQMCTFDRQFTANNLYHTTFNIYY